MALKIAESAPKPDEDKGIPLDSATPEESGEADQELALKQEEATKAMTKAKEALEETPPSGNSSEEWGLRLTDRFNVVRQKESFMLVEHRPSQDRDGNPTTKTLKTYHPSVEQIIGKMAKVHVLDLLEQEQVDNFVDAVTKLTSTLRDTVGPLLEAAEAKHTESSVLGGNVYLDFLGRLKTGLKVAEKSEAFEVDGQQVMPVEAVYKAIETEFPGGKDES